MTDFEPPQAIQAEQSILGALLLKPDAWDDVADFLGERDFYLKEHQLIFRHVTHLLEAGERVDVITVAESLERTGKLDRVGGLPYLGELAANVPSARNIASYARIVVDRRKERDLLCIIADLQETSEAVIPVAQKVETAINALATLADNRADLPISLSDATQEALNSLSDRVAQGGGAQGLKTGFLDLDRLTGGLQPGDLIILAGRPSMGKTALAINIAENVALDGAGSVLVFSLEMSAQQLAQRSLSTRTNVGMSRIRNADVGDSDFGRFGDALGRAFDARFFIDPNPTLTASQMHARARRIKRQHSLDLVVIDYLQLMTEGGENRNAELSTITRKLKLMAKDLGVPVICLSQLNRELEKRSNKRPIMSDLRDSGAIEQDADLILFIYRDDYYNPDSPNKGLAEVNIAKQRMGPTGTIHLTFQGEFSRFANFAGEVVQESPRVRDIPKRGFSRPYSED